MVKWWTEYLGLEEPLGCRFIYWLRWFVYLRRRSIHIEVDPCTFPPNRNDNSEPPELHAEVLPTLRKKVSFTETPRTKTTNLYIFGGAGITVRIVVRIWQVQTDNFLKDQGLSARICLRPVLWNVRIEEFLTKTDNNNVQLTIAYADDQSYQYYKKNDGLVRSN